MPHIAVTCQAADDMANVTAKDFMLEILRHPFVKSGKAIGKGSWSRLARGAVEAAGRPADSRRSSVLKRSPQSLQR